MSKKKRVTAAELMAELAKDPDYVDRRRSDEEKWRLLEEEDARVETPMVQELRAAGAPVSSSVWDLVNTTAPYPQALPILVDHLQRSYPDAIREGIARALAVPEAKLAWPLLVKLYRQEPNTRTKNGLAVALGNVADDELIGELIDLASDPQNGESRLHLLHRLAKSRDPGARKALLELEADPQLEKEIKYILRCLNRSSRQRGKRQRRDDS